MNLLHMYDYSMLGKVFWVLTFTRRISPLATAVILLTAKV
jgi:hypothetical protein